MQFKFSVPTQIIFGEGSLSELSSQKLPGSRALLVLSRGGSARRIGAFDKVYSALNSCGEPPVVYEGIGANPSLEQINEGARIAREGGCDFVVALGGGSVMDAAKAISVLAPNGENYWDFVTAGTGGGLPIKNRALPVVAITTTAGTGSEADATAVVTNPETGEKIGFVHPQMFPVLSIIDSTLTYGVPAMLTAYQGFDALFHAVECYISAKANKMSDMLALTSMEYVGKFLARAVKDGSDAEARDGMSFANMLSGMVMTLSGCTANHGMEHAMSAFNPALPHGAGLIMLATAYFSRELAAGVEEERFVRMARAMGYPAKTGEDFLAALQSLMTECGVDGLKMSDYGITPHNFPALADKAMSSMARVFANERVPMSREEVIEVYQKSYR